MNDKRSPHRILVIGAQETGKTATGIYLFENALTNKKYHIALLYDDDEEKFHHYPEIFVGEEPLEFCRIIFDEDDEYFLETFRKTYKNAGVLIDDTMMFLEDRKNENFRKIYMRSRQRVNDVICTFHGLSEVPPSFFNFATDIILHRTKDSPKRAEYKIEEDRFEKIMAAYEELKKYPYDPPNIMCYKKIHLRF